MSAYYQLIISGRCAGQLIQNVIHYNCSESGTSTAFERARALIDAWVAGVQTDWLAPLATDFELTSLKCKKVSGVGGPTAIAVYPTGTAPGTGDSVCGDTANAALLEFPVFLNGKNVTGKIFHAPIPKTMITDNTLNATVVTQETTLLTTLGATITLAGALGTADHVIYHRATQVGAIPMGNQVSPLIGTQRRRLHPF